MKYKDKAPHPKSYRPDLPTISTIEIRQLAFGAAVKSRMGDTSWIAKEARRLAKLKKMQEEADAPPP